MSKVKMLGCYHCGGEFEVPGEGMHTCPNCQGRVDSYDASIPNGSDELSAIKAFVFKYGPDAKLIDVINAELKSK